MSNLVWHKPTNHPLGPKTVLVGLNIDGIRTSCEGYLDSSPHAPATDRDGAQMDDGMAWYAVDGEPINPAHITGWTELPEGPSHV